MTENQPRRVERWVPGSDRPELLAKRLTWQPRSGLLPLEIDLTALFKRPDRGLADS